MNTVQAMPMTRGTLTRDRALADLTWLRVGGPADLLLQPADPADLAAFLAALDPSVPVFPMGVGSNLIVRDGGIRGVVIRPWAGLQRDQGRRPPRDRRGRGARCPCGAQGGGAGPGSDLSAHHTRGHRWGRAHECGLLWAICCRPFRVCRGRDAIRRNRDPDGQ